MFHTFFICGFLLSQSPVSVNNLDWKKIEKYIFDGTAVAGSADTMHNTVVT